MKTFKYLPRLFAVFGLVMMFVVSGWGANVDLNLSKTAPSTVTPGASLAYTLTARNKTTNKTISTVKIVDTLPLGVQYSSMNGSDWTCSASTYNATVAQVVTCTLGVTLATSTTAQVLTINTTAQNTVGNITNSAIVSQTATINDEWGCLEFKDGAVDIEPNTLYKYCETHNQSQGE